MWGITVGNWSVIPRRIPWIQCRWCCSKWFHLRSEGLGSLYPSFWQASDVEFTGYGIEFPGMDSNELRKFSGKEGPVLAVGSWAWGSVWQWYEWEHSTWSPAVYATSYVCTYTVSLYDSPLTLEDFMILFLFSESPNFKRMGLYIYLKGPNIWQGHLNKVQSLFLAL